MKRTICVLALSSLMVLSACSSGPSDEEAARQEIFETNVTQTPELTDNQKEMIMESRGVVIGEETGEDEEIYEIFNSFSPGDDVVDYLASMTKEELLEMDTNVHLEIFINGVIRDEYRVSAHTLYGAERIEGFKEAFRSGLLENAPLTDTDEEIEMAYIDRIGWLTDIKDPNVARHHIDVITSQLNRIFVQVNQQSDFGSRVTVNGQVYPIQLKEQLTAVNDAAFEFVGVSGDKYRSRMTDSEVKELNTYYVDTFGDALLQAPISQENFWTSEIGGFEKQDDGTWEPAQMPQFAWNLIQLVYGIR